MLKKIFKRVDNKAFTIIEILLAVALLAIAAVAIGAVIISTQNNTAQMFSDTELQQQLVEVQENLHNEILGTNAGIKCWAKQPDNGQWVLTSKVGGGDSEVIVAFYNLDMTDYSLTKTYYKYDPAKKTIVVGHGTPDTVTKTTKNNCNLCNAILSQTSNKCPSCGATIIDSIQHTVDPDISTSLNNVTDWSMVAASVSHFTFDVTSYDATKLISYEVKLESAEAVYPADETVYMRNKITVNKDVFEIEKYHHVQIEIPTIEHVSFTYDGNPHGPTEINYLSRFVDRTADSVLTATDCGVYKITYKLKDKTATTWTDGTTADKVYTWTISKKILQLQWGETEWNYDGQTHSTTCVPVGILDSDDCEIILSNNSIGPDVGQVTCTATTSNPNYGVPSISTVILKIKPVSASVTISAVNKTYMDPGVAQSMVSYSDLVGGDLKFYISRHNIPPSDESVRESACNATDAGTYYIWYKIVSKNDNYTSTGVKYLGESVMHRSPTASYEWQNFVYDEEYHNGVTGNGVVITGTHTAKNAGTYTATIQPDSNHYWTNNSDGAETQTWTISKANGHAVAPTGYDDLVYNTYLQTLIKSAATTEYGYVEYKLEGGTWSTEFPKAINATDDEGYKVYYRSLGDSNHHATSGEDFIRVPIARARMSFVNKTNQTYTGNAQLGYIDFDKVDITGQYSAKDHGTYTFYATPYVNYAWFDGGYEQRAFEWTMNKATVTFTAPVALQPTYTGSALELITKGSTSDGVIQYSVDNITWTSTVPYGVNATTYTVYYRLEADANHISISPTKVANVWINRQPTAYARSLNPRYNGTTQDGVTGLHVIWTGKTTGKDIGTYQATATLDPNYTWEPNSGLTNDIEVITWEMKKGVGYCDPPVATNPTYNGTMQNVHKAATNATGTVEYSWYENGPWSTEILQWNEVGTWPLYYRTQANELYEQSEIGQISVSIKLNATANIVHRTSTEYNGSAQNGYTSLQFVDLSGDYSATSVGKYTYIATPKQGYAWSNGSTDPKSITWEITVNKSATHSVSSPQYTGQSLTGVTYTHCSVTGTVTATDVGQYSATLTPLPGYAWNDGSVTAKQVTWSITAAPASLTTAPTGKSNLTYNTKNQELCSAGTCSGGTMQYKIGSNGTWSNSIPTGQNATTYTIYYRVVGDSNHSTLDEGKYITATINPAACTVATKPTGLTLTYTGSNQSLISGGASSTGGTMYYKVESSTGSVLQDWTNDLSKIVAKESDTYTVYYQARANNSNYTNSAAGSTTAKIEGFTFMVGKRAWAYGHCDKCNTNTYNYNSAGAAKAHSPKSNNLGGSDVRFNIKTIYKGYVKQGETLLGPVAGYSIESSGAFYTASGTWKSGTGFVPSENCYVKPNYE